MSMLPLLHHMHIAWTDESQTNMVDFEQDKKNKNRPEIIKMLNLFRYAELLALFGLFLLFLSLLV